MISNSLKQNCELENNTGQLQFFESEVKPMCYAGWINDYEQRKKSSSGGMFSALAQYTFSIGGVVYAVQESSRGLEYRRALSIDEIDGMRGSKYYQANNNTIPLSEINSDIVKRKCVLIIGTPCQIGMFYSCFKYIYGTVPNNIVLVDLICHGVASKRIVDMYRTELSSSHRFLVQHLFRSKEPNSLGSQYSEYHFSDGKIIRKNNDNDLFMRSYYPGFFLRPSCYCCSFTNVHRLSDITIGDYNGANRIIDSFPDENQCVSAIISRSARGQDVLEYMANAGIVTLVESDYETIASQNINLKAPVKQRKSRTVFFLMLNKIGFMNTCRLFSGKHYFKSIIIAIGGKQLLNTAKRMFGRTIIE